MTALLVLLAAAVGIAGFAACTPPPRGANALPFEDLTLQNLVRFPDGREYMTVSGVGYPQDGQKDTEERRKTAREGAAVAAQEKLIVELKKVAPHERVRDLLRQAEVAKLDYAYDDICTLTLRLPKELIAGKESTPWQ